MHFHWWHNEIERFEFFGFIMITLAFLFFLETARELIGTIYSMNLATLSLNSSVVAILAFFSPLAYLCGLSRFTTRMLIVTSGATLGIFRIAMVLEPPLIVYLLCAVGAAVSFGVFLPALTVALQRSRSAVLLIICAATSGAGLDIMFRALGDTFDISVYGVSVHRSAALMIVLPLIICFFLGLLLWHSPQEHERTENSHSVRAFFGISIGAVGFLYLALLGYPNNVARWVEGSYFLAAVLSGAALGGFLIASFTHVKTWLFSKTGIAVGSATLLAALVSCIAPPTPFIAVLLCASAIFFLPVQLYTTFSYLIRPGVTLQQVGAFLGTAAVTFVGFILLSVFSLTYSYVPGMNVLRNQIDTIILVAGGSALLIVLGYRARSAQAKVRTSFLTAALGVTIIVGTSVGALSYRSYPPRIQYQSLVVMTYNIQQGFNTEGKINPWDILEPIVRVNPDILALQESDTDRVSSANVDIVQWLAHKLDMHIYFGPKTKQQTFGVAILSKYEMCNEKTYYLTSIGEQVVLVRADILWTSGIFSVYVTHLGETEEDRSTQTAEILEIMSANPNRKILMGDFNSLPDSEQIAAFTEVLNDAWTRSGYSPADPLGYTISSLNPHDRIDYIMISPEAAVKACEVIRDVYGSDHLPLWAEISW